MKSAKDAINAKKVIQSFRALQDHRIQRKQKLLANLYYSRNLKSLALKSFHRLLSRITTYATLRSRYYTSLKSTTLSLLLRTVRLRLRTTLHLPPPPATCCPLTTLWHASARTWLLSHRRQLRSLASSLSHWRTRMHARQSLRAAESRYTRERRMMVKRWVLGEMVRAYVHRAKVRGH
jgi:hypothetical protein